MTSTPQLSLEFLFSITGSAAALAWLALAFAPLRHRWPERLAIAMALAIGTLYVALIGVFWAQGDGGFGSLDAVARLLEQKGMLLAGWVHYLAFDLLIGTWERREAQRIGVAQWALLPCLALTFVFGPLGWLLFMAVRLFHLRTTRPAAAVGWLTA